MEPVTERARKLRAQYALQAQGLRTRVELRINRIPSSLRGANIGELFLKYQEATKPAQNDVSPQYKGVQSAKDISSANKVDKSSALAKNEVGISRSRGVKRKRFAHTFVLGV